MILKSKLNLVSTFFALQFINILGVRAPHMKIVSATDDEFKLLLMSVDWATRF